MGNVTKYLRERMIIATIYNYTLITEKCFHIGSVRKPAEKVVGVFQRRTQDR